MQKDDLVYEVIISDTSSLSNFVKIGRLDLFKKLYDRVTITPEVLEEYLLKFKDKLPEWIDIKEAKDKNRVAEINNKLGLGESSAIALANEKPDTSLLIVDDKKARNYAIDMGLDTIGSIGIIRRAVKKNIIKSKEEANRIFEDLKSNGLWINDELFESIKYPI